MKQNARLIKLLRLVLLLLVFSLSAMICTGGGTVEAAPTQITMSIEQWNSLKQETNLAQLNEAKKQLNLTQEALMNSKHSLVSAEESLNHSEALYKKLTEQMELERREAKRIKYQRNIYASSALLFLLCAAAK